MAKPALGRGLGALLQSKPAPAPSTSPHEPPESEGSMSLSDPSGQVRRVAIDKLRPSSLQPRKVFPESALRELADSIREKGVIQPLITRQAGDHFELIAGERRWRASQMAGLSELPVIVKEVDDSAALEMMLIENLQRENLNPIEEARGYAELIQKFNLKQDDVARRVGKGRVVVANSLRLLKLPDTLQTLVRDGHLSVGHAKVLLGLSSPEQQEEAARKVIKDGMSVRATEHWIGDFSDSAGRPAQRKSTKKSKSTGPDGHIRDLEEKLCRHFGAKVSLKYRDGKGSVEIRFFSDDELERIFQLAGFRMDE